MIIQRIVFLVVMIAGVLESASLSAGRRPRSRSMVGDGDVEKAFASSAARAAAVARAAALFAKEYAAELAPPGPAELAARDAAARQRLAEGGAGPRGTGPRDPLFVVELTAPTHEAVAVLEACIRGLEIAVFDACQHGEAVLGDDSRLTLLLREWKERLEGGVAAQRYIIAFNRLKYRYTTMPPEIFIQIFPAFMRATLPCERETKAENMHGAFIRFFETIERVFVEIAARKKKAAFFDSRWHGLARLFKAHGYVIRQNLSGAAAAVSSALSCDEQRELFFSQPIDACDQVILRPLKPALKKTAATERPTVKVSTGQSPSGAAAAVSTATLTTDGPLTVDGPLRAAIIVSGSPHSPALSVGGEGPSSLASSSSSGSLPGRLGSGRSRRAFDEDCAARSCVRSSEGAVVAARPAVVVSFYGTIAAADVVDYRFEFTQEEVAAAFDRSSSPAAAAAASSVKPEWNDALRGLDDDLAGSGLFGVARLTGIGMLTRDSRAFAAAFDVRGLMGDDTPCPEYDYSSDSRADGCGNPSTPDAHGSGDVARGGAGGGAAVVVAHDPVGKTCGECGDEAVYACNGCRET